MPDPMRLVYALALLTLAGCGAPEIDGSSKEAFRESVVKVTEALPVAERPAFTQAMAALAMSALTPELMMSGDTTAMTTSMMALLNGATAEEVLEAAKTAKPPDMGAMMGAAMAGAFAGAGAGAPTPGRSSGLYDDSVRVGRVEVSAGYGGDGQITAVVTNLSRREMQSVEVSFDLFEADGVRSRSTLPAFVTDLPPGESARVDEGYYQHEGIDSVAVGDVSATVAPTTP